MIISNLPKRDVRDYKGIVGNEVINNILDMASELGGYSVTHVNSTSFGGGVAEILHSLVPLFNSLGIRTVWEVIEAPPEFFNVTKKIHNALQGAKIDLSDDEKKLYLSVNKINAEKVLQLSSDVVIIHDPQPLAVRKFLSNGRRWVWRCHIDLSTPYRSVLKFISELLKGYNASIYHMKEFIHPNIPTSKKFVIPPSIDPLNDKNKELTYSEIVKILSKFDVDLEKPIIVQVARFDPWKDPFGAINTYKLVKRKIPNVQLLLISSMAHDDPEGWIYFEKTVRYACGDSNIRFLTNLIGVGPLEVNAFQRAADVALQLSIKEGFGLAVAEALWKKTPVVARPSGGIVMQVINGATGYLVNSVEEAANKIIYLLKNPDIRKKLGEEGHKLIKENFIVTKHIERYLRTLKELLKEEN